MSVVFRADGRNLAADLGPLHEAMRTADERQVLPPDLSRVAVIAEDGTAAGELTVLEIGFGGQAATRLIRMVGLLRLPPPPTP